MKCEMRTKTEKDKTGETECEGERDKQQQKKFEAIIKVFLIDFFLLN